jgi:ribosomal protein S18 acetylase RimI-like enzyme
MTDVTIRPGRPDDAAAASDLAFRAKSSAGYPQEWLALWRDALTIRPDELGTRPSFVAVRGRDIVGICVLETRGHDASLEHLWVAPGLQRHGIGRTLVERVLTLAASAGVRRVEVESDPFAKGFYLRLGARRLGERPAPMPGAPARVLPLLQFTLDASGHPADRPPGPAGGGQPEVA